MTLLLFQPEESGAGDKLADMTGTVSSMLILTVAVVATPALFVAVPCTTWFAPTVVTGTGEGHVFTPTFVSTQVKETVTLELFHPFALGAGVTVAVITGGGGKVKVAVVLAVPVTLRPSSTVSATVKVPVEEYVCVGVAPVAVVPSPKFQL